MLAGQHAARVVCNQPAVVAVGREGGWLGRFRRKRQLAGLSIRAKVRERCRRSEDRIGQFRGQADGVQGHAGFRKRLVFADVTPRKGR